MHCCPFALITIDTDAGRVTRFDAVAAMFMTSAVPPEAVESRTVPAAKNTDRLIDSPSITVGVAASATGAATEPTTTVAAAVARTPASASVLRGDRSHPEVTRNRIMAAPSGLMVSKESCLTFSCRLQLRNSLSYHFCNNQIGRAHAVRCRRSTRDRHAFLRHGGRRRAPPEFAGVRVLSVG